MITTTPTAAAEALAAALPVTSAVTPVLVPGPVAPQAGEILSASFVGNPSADLALALTDPSAILGGAGSGLLALGDMLRPALEAAASTLGTGVLGEASVSGADPVFTDADASVFSLQTAAGTLGYFAVRVRGNASGTASGLQPLTIPALEKHLSRINDVEMTLTVEIGRTRMAVRDVLSLEPGGVIELDRSAGAPADVLLNGRLIAHGEVVVVDQDYAVRITRILDLEGLS